MNRYSIIYLLLALITVFTITAWLVQPFSEEEYSNLLNFSAFIILSICGLILLIFIFKMADIPAQAKKGLVINSSSYLFLGDWGIFLHFI